MLFLLILAVGILASVPPVSKDALVHHLAIPKLYLKHGGMYEIPFMSYSYYPMNLDLLYLIPLYFGNDIIPKFIHFSFGILSAWLIFSYLKRRMNLAYALGGVLFFLSIPIVIKLSITAYVDLGLIFFSTASLFALFKWRDSGFQLKFLVLSAMFCGLAMGSKYNGLIIFFLLTFFVPFIYSRYAPSAKPNHVNVIGQAVIFAGLALLVFSPWMIRNYLWTHNPIYPLYNHWFNPQHLINYSPGSIFEFRSAVYHESWWQMALLPVRVFFQGQDGNPQYFDGRLNPFLLLFPLMAFYGMKKDALHISVEKKILLAFTALYFAFSFFATELRIRYISPIIPPLVLLSVYGFKNMMDLLGNLNFRSVRRIGFMLAFGIVFFSFFLNAGYLFKQYREVDPFAFLSGSLNRDAYIDRYRFENPVMRYINKNLPADAKILFIYMGNRGYYSDREYLFDIPFNRSILGGLVRTS